MDQRVDENAGSGLREVRPLVSLCAAVSLLFGSAGATAQSSAVEARPLVALALDGDWPPSLARAVRADFAARLRERGLRLVDASWEPSRTSGAVHMEAPRDGRVRMRVLDFINDKQLERDVQLAAEPSDVWATLLATTADELLRAAWMEVLLEDAPPPRRSPPEAVRRSVQATLARPPPRPSRMVSAGADVDVYTGGGVLIGGALGLAYHVRERFLVEVGAYGSAMLPAASRLGSVNARSFGGDLALRVPLFDHALRIELLAAGRAGVVIWRGSARDGVEDGGATEALVSLRGGLRAMVFPHASWSLGITLAVGGPLVSSVAHDDQGPVVGLSNVVFSLGFDVGHWR